MDWIILFAASWIMFILLIDWKKLKANIWCGLLAVALQLSVDTHAMHHKLYKVDDGAITLWGSSVFFILGPVLTIGTLIAQYYPRKRWVQILNPLILSGLYSLQELLLIARNDLIYLNWHYMDSILVNTVVMASLGWFSIVILQKTKDVER